MEGKPIENKPIRLGSCKRHYFQFLASCQVLFPFASSKEFNCHEALLLEAEDVDLNAVPFEYCKSILGRTHSLFGLQQTSSVNGTVSKDNIGASTAHRKKRLHQTGIIIDPACC